MSQIDREALVRLLRAAYPHPTFPDGPYERTADIVIERAEGDRWTTLALTEGLAGLDARAATAGADGFAGTTDEQADALLREIAAVDFFAFVRGIAVVALYDDHEVWELLGYEGPSFDQGGYLHRGFDDLDWLPSPRVEEYDGPEQLVEVADGDVPQGGTR